MIARYHRTRARLLEQAPEILHRWDQRVRAEIPASRKQDPLVLRNNLATLLVEVAKALRPGGEPDVKIEGLTVSQDHGAHRASLSEYSIAEMFLEYRLLRQTILDVLDEEKSLGPREREIINDALERAMQDAVARFAMVHEDVQKQRAEELLRANAELRVAYARERRIASVLQRPLLLKVSEDAVPGLSLATVYEPAQKEAEVGGDFFDVVPLPGGSVALVVGDTCGKGLEAAARNTHVKDVLRAFLRDDPAHPGAVLGRLNRAVCDMLVGGDALAAERFVVLMLLVIDPNSGAAVYVGAGAEPLLLLRSGGETEEMHRPAFPLGVEPEETYNEVHLRLEPADTAVMVTDGITEARGGGALLGYQGFVKLAREAARRPSLQAAAQEILDGARSFACGPLQDDACLILARRV